MKQESPAIHLLRYAWEHNGGASNNHSWDRINHAMSTMLRYCITFGVRFDVGDFSLMASEFRSAYWIGTPPEWAYRMACSGEDSQTRRGYGPNMSACLSFEAWKMRKPFIIKTHLCLSGKRLYVGEKFQWINRKGDPEWLTVTSFDDGAGTLTACSYREPELDEHGYHKTAKIKSRYSITHEQVLECNLKVAAHAKIGAKR